MKDSKNFFAKNNRLNKGYSKETSPTKADNVFYRKQFEHILPPLELIEEFENSYPGTIDKLVAMAQQEQLHRHQLDVRNQDFYEQVAKIGRVVAIILMGLICLTIVALSMINYVIAIVFTIFVFLGILGGAFLFNNKFYKKRDYNKYKKQP